MESPLVAAVVLTRGDRPQALQQALASIRSQRNVDVHIVVVANGIGPEATTGIDADTIVHLDTNVGIPEGRNVGARSCDAELVLFLDDDAELADHDTLTSLVGQFGADPSLAAVGLRLVDEHGATSQRHVPRWGGRGADRCGEVTAFLGGAVMMRSAAFAQVGGYAGQFFYAMEESDLSLRLIDAGWTLWYDANHQVRHPRVEPSRHAGAAEHTARNRVWMAHRSLPALMAVLYVTNWLVITTARQPRQVGAVLRGYRTGWRTRIGPRRPISWATVWRLTRLGRPPVV